MDVNRADTVKRQIMVGQAKRLFDSGLTTVEVANKLHLSESTVRSLKKTIDDANNKS